MTTAFEEAMKALDEQEPARRFANSMANQWHTEGRVEGRKEGERHTKVTLIDGLIRAGVSWDVIETATGMDESQFEALRAQVVAQ